MKIFIKKNWENYITCSREYELMAKKLEVWNITPNSVKVNKLKEIENWTEWSKRHVMVPGTPEPAHEADVPLQTITREL